MGKKEQDVTTQSKRMISLRKRLMELAVFFWIFPVCIIFIFVFFSYRNSIIKKTEILMEEKVKNFSVYCTQQIDEAIKIAKKLSYDCGIEEAYRDYSDHKITNTMFYNIVSRELNGNFRHDSRFVTSVFYLIEQPNKLYYTSKLSTQYLNYYNEVVREEASEISLQDNSNAIVKIIDGQLYIIRNLYTTRNYTKFGTLVVQMDKSKIFDMIQQEDGYQFSFYINEIESVLFQNQLNTELEKSIVEQFLLFNKEIVKEKVIKFNDSFHSSMLYETKQKEYSLGTVIIADKNKIYSELRLIYVIIFLVILIMIPVCIYMLYFLSKHITLPINRMLKASKEMEQGGIGNQIEGDSMPNTEFDYLMTSFNKMSLEVKYLFDCFYDEKLARKDAKIIALQSQINPHFLNNTLEMMNWQARMAGDITVSKMIEALSTLLDYSMDRSNRKLISLAEELRCADAYFYIISMRFGKRLQVVKEIDANLLQTKVPQLILQPLLENAVIHGVEEVKQGVVTLQVYQQDDSIFLRIKNTGKGMSSEDIERVEKILNGEMQNNSKMGKHVSLGIRNVNERIKLIYGDKYGLSIVPGENEETISTIIIPYKNINDTNKEDVMDDLFKRKK